ncbi:hypothetical protein SVIOM74S_03911 [Streptomyces violarus]
MLIVTDEQYTHHHRGDPTEQVPGDVPVYTWNLAGYRAAARRAREPAHLGGRRAASGWFR